MIYAGIGQKASQTEDYVRGLLAYQCMPTLLKAKPSVLVTANKKLIWKPDMFFVLLEQYLRCFECSCLPLQETGSRIYLLLYHEPLLQQSLKVKQRRDFLAVCGYKECGDSVEGALTRLGELYHGYWRKGVFPHEIGIFLGYPLADVTGFITNRGRDYLMCGMWKVYQRAETAAAAFQSYRSMKEQAVGLLEGRNDLTEILNNGYTEERIFLKKLLEY